MMFDIIASAYPRLIAALRRSRGLTRAEAAQLLLAAKYGERAAVWTSSDCSRARSIIRAAFVNRAARLRLSVEG
ncbi:MAG TPA: hypothetical protein VFW19_10475 [Allosphingosinicella sp.]|nr:hypothetical protein [Allosphingosinicella sp.]